MNWNTHPKVIQIRTLIKSLAVPEQRAYYVRGKFCRHGVSLPEDREECCFCKAENGDVYIQQRLNSLYLKHNPRGDARYTKSSS